jgi:hypothetical protein
MDNSRPYRQAVENVAWEIHRLSYESKKRGESTEMLVVQVSLNPEIGKEWEALDDIIRTICSMYQVGNNTIQQDILEVLKEYENPDKR